MEPVREITKKEYYAPIKEMETTGKAMADEKIKEGWKFPSYNIPLLYFCSSRSDYPCLYDINGEGTAINPKTKRRVKKKLLPKKYRLVEPPGVWTTHLTLDGCPLIKPFKSLLRCAFTKGFGDDRKYYTCEHLAGECPAKMTREEAEE